MAANRDMGEVDAAQPPTIELSECNLWTVCGEIFEAGSSHIAVMSVEEISKCKRQGKIKRILIEETAENTNLLNSIRWSSRYHCPRAERVQFTLFGNKMTSVSVWHSIDFGSDTKPHDLDYRAIHQYIRYHKDHPLYGKTAKVVSYYRT